MSQDSSTPTTSVQITYQIPPPESFNFACPSDWPKWKRRFDRFHLAANLHNKTGLEQINALVYTMGDEADEIMASFNLTTDEQKDYLTVLNRFESHFIIRRNPIYERAKFNSRIQEENESVDSFVTALHTLSEHCEYQCLREELIRDRLIVGLRNRKLSEGLQMDADLTLAKAVEKARQSEEIKKQQTVLYKETNQNQVCELNKMEARDRRSTTRKYNSRTMGHTNVKNNEKYNKIHGEKCKWCGKIPSHVRVNCPAKDKVCGNCRTKGHFAAVCRLSQRNVASIESESEEEIDTLFMGKISNSDPKRDMWKINIEIGGVPLDFKIDTGADVSAIPYKWFKANKLEGTFLKTNRKLRGPQKSKLQVIGKLVTLLNYKDKIIKQDVYIIKELSVALLGKPEIENLELIKRIYSVETDKVQDEFPKLFTGLGLMDGEYQIRLKPEAKPYAIYSARRVPIPRMEALKKELERMVEQQVITTIDEPTEWCAPMVIAPKSNGKIRVCVDLTQLNKSVLREHHPLPAIEHILAQMPGAKIFSKLDANSGFWQIKLEENSRKLTTFISPFGRYCFNRLPFGITSAPEYFQKKMTGILKGLEGVVCLTDDVLVWGVDQAQHDGRLRQVLKRLSQANVTLNKAKSQFSKNKVKFLGHIIDSEGIHPDPEKVEAINSMKAPRNIEELRRFIGMVNYLARFIPNMADNLQPLSCLLKKGTAWGWDANQEKAFQEVKRVLCSDAVLALYDPTKETILSTDASSYGLGAVLRQVQRDGRLRPVAYASRTLTATEGKYAQIEKESLGIVWGCERLRDLLIGKQFHIETDHKPLVSIMTSKQLDELSPRLQRLKMRMMRYTYTISHIPGKDLIAADTLSRAPSIARNDEDKELSQEIETLIREVVQELPASEKKIEEIKQAQKSDSTCQQLYKYSQEGWPKRNQISPNCQPYWKFSSELVIQEGLLMRNNRILIPSAKREEILKRIHEGHMGISKCRERAKFSVWWPGISAEIKELVTNCTKCIEQRTNPKEPMIPSEFPSTPWEKVGMDLFHWNGKWWLLVTDYFSRYPEIVQLQSLKTAIIINSLKEIFGRHGIPKIVRSDNGPQFHVVRNSEFSKYARTEEFEHITSSPRYPKSNGLIEASVKTIKLRLKKSEDLHAALLAYRNTPLENGYSPSQLLMGRRLRSRLPMAEALLQPKWPNLDEVKEKEAAQRAKQKLHYDDHHKTKVLQSLKPQDKVWITDLHRAGRVITEAKTPRSYIIETSTGMTIRRNRHHLIPSPKASIPDEEEPEMESTKESGGPEVVNTNEQSEIPEARDVIRTRSGRIVRAPKRLDL